MAESKAFILSVYDLDLAQVGERVLGLPIRIGRSSLNDVCVAHRLVSEFHARIEEVDERLCVRDLNSKNGVLLEALGGDGAVRIPAQLPTDLEPYGYDFLLSPLLRVRVRPATGREGIAGRHSQAVGSVLGNAALAVNAAALLADDRRTEGFAPQHPGRPAHAVATPQAPPVPVLRPTPVAPSAEREIEALALRGLRELAASLVPGQPVESTADVAQLITKLHDSFEMFCQCFIPVREACSRFIPTAELERAASERSRHGSASNVGIERALEPRAVAAALLDWRNDDHDAPRAVEHILADLMLHHLTLSQAAIEGTKALLDQLSPASIQGAHVRTPSMLSRLGLAEAPECALWETFTDRHAELAAVGSSFRELFGEQFSRVYAAHWPTPGNDPSL